MAYIQYERLKEWTESPVAEKLREVIKKELDNVYEERGEVFLEDDAVRTHVIRSNLIGQEAVLADMIGILELDPATLDKYFTLNEVEVVRNNE